MYDLLIYIRCLFTVEEALVKKKGKTQEHFIVNCNELLVGPKTTQHLHVKDKLINDM